MPRYKTNATFLSLLQDMRDEEDPSSNKYMILKKAFDSLKKETKEYSDPESLIAVKFIGPRIVSELKKRREAAIGETSSYPPPPTKCNGSSDAASASQPNKRGRLPKKPAFDPESDYMDVLSVLGSDDVANLGREHISGHFHKDMQFASGTPRYPLAILPQTSQPHMVNTLPAYQHDTPQCMLYDPHLHIHQRIPKPVPLNVSSVPPNSLQPFSFCYIDANGNQVLHCDGALVDIEERALWYKIGVFDCPNTRLHPLRQRIRLDPHENRQGNRRGYPIMAWINDGDVEQFGLHMAPGFRDVETGMCGDRLARTSEFASQNARNFQGDIRELVSKNTHVEQLKNSQAGSLEDLLGAEGLRKRNSRRVMHVIDIDEEWKSSGSGVVRREEPRLERDLPIRDSMRQHLEMMTMAGQQTSSIGAGRSLSFRSQVSSNLLTNSTLSKSSILPEVPYELNALPSIQVDPSFSTATTSTQRGALSASQRSGDGMTTHAFLPSVAPTRVPKAKKKVIARGRVSEFAPALPAVDEFDAVLDRQAAKQAVQVTSEPASNAYTDLNDDVTGLNASNEPSFPPFDPIVFPPGSFDIALVLDTREIKSQRNRDYIATALREQGVNVLQRSLTLGDVLWIAQRRTLDAGAEDNECVLDYILERKRLDDLCHSIKDGRFREQKFRLANTGLKVFYLIEEYDLQNNRESFGVQIDTARSSTQIVDGFIVKETKKLSHTIDFLATMHRTIVEKYWNEPLYIIPPNLIRRHSYMAFQKHLQDSQPNMRYLTSYASFGRLNSKSGNLTARDLFAQMLLCVKGLSPEKAAAIIETYPTVRSLWEAFRDAEAAEREGRGLEDEHERAAGQGGKGRGRKKTRKVPQANAMLCDLEGSGRRRIGPVLSAKVYRLMRANSYEE